MTRLSIPLSRGRIDVQLADDEAVTDAMLEAWRAVGEHALSELHAEAPDDMHGRVVVEVEISPIDGSKP